MNSVATVRCGIYCVCVVVADGRRVPADNEHSARRGVASIPMAATVFYSPQMISQPVTGTGGVVLLAFAFVREVVRERSCRVCLP